VNQPAAHSQTALDLSLSARRLVDARRRAQALDAFPAPIPDSLAAAYACQDAAIRLWPDVIIGWKVGRIGADLVIADGDDRLTGPIFRRALRRATPGAEVLFPVFEGGFAAVEAELVFHLYKDAPADKTSWSPDEAAALVGTVHVGIETAGSPMAMINDLGPNVIISDFGNNAGLILGGAIGDWQMRVPEITCESFIDGVSVGRGAPGATADLLQGLCFALRRQALRGRPLKAGDYISSGAITGIHDIRVGQAARVSFTGVADIQCRAIAAVPETTSGG
jgi:2-keto-4-pentenoate hydratase